jgi:hypothetical protein
VVSSLLAKTLCEFILVHVTCLTVLVPLYLVIPILGFTNYDAASMLVQAERLGLVQSLQHHIVNLAVFCGSYALQLPSLSSNFLHPAVTLSLNS